MEYRNYVRCGVGVHLIKRGRDKLAVEPGRLRSGGGAREGCRGESQRVVCEVRLQVQERPCRLIGASYRAMNGPTESKRIGLNTTIITGMSRMAWRAIRECEKCAILLRVHRVLQSAAARANRGIATPRLLEPESRACLGHVVSKHMHGGCQSTKEWRKS
jgi:hypothetical protein